MKSRSHENDEIEMSERYDREDDIYYVTVKTGEPSLAREFDDRLLLEYGMFTGLPTGFRILNYSKNKANADAFKVAFKGICKDARIAKQSECKQVNRRIEQAFDKVGV